LLRIVLGLLLLAFLLVSSVHADTPPAFKIGIEMPMQIPVSEHVKSALKDLGISYINYYVYNGCSEPKPDAPAADVNKAGMDLADYLGADFSIAGCNYDPPDDCVRTAVERYKSNGRFRGVLIDELEWVRLMVDYSPVRLAYTSKCQTLEQASDLTLAGYQKTVSKFAGLGTQLTSTHVWPILHHTAARAGCIVSPKICKEFFSPVSLAIGMGAAKEYGRQLWVDCDMWFWDLVPGHTPEEIRSNLLLAYWLGADLVYLEGCGYNLIPAGKQGSPFSLINTGGEVENAQFTPIGEMLRSFCRDYLPAHKREWTFRDVNPSIAIVRFDDTCHGQRYTGVPDNLFGSANLHSNADTEAWLQIWNTITFGKTGRDGISFFKAYMGGYGWDRPPGGATWPSYASRPMQADSHRFFVPMNGAVVYDHLVGYDLLKGIPLLFLSGTEVSEQTMQAIRKCVNEGAVCVAWGPLAVKNGFKEWKSGVSVIPTGKGKFIITDDFGLGKVYGEISMLLGRADEIKYRFGSRTVVLKRVTDNEVNVDIQM